jgi:glycosyltransferase involved in cell wall biosynthesis
MELFLLFNISKKMNQYKNEKMKILMIGQFCPPVTGEAMVNEKVYTILQKQNFTIKKLSSSIIHDPNDVGRFSIIKVWKSFVIYFNFLKIINSNTIVYLTPGQTKLGIYRIIPILVICRFYRVKVIAHWHGYGLLWLIQKHREFITHILRMIDVNILLTNHLQQEIGKIFPNLKKAYVITNYVAENEIIKKNNITNKLTVLYVGSLMEEKGVLYFLEAAKALSNIQFNICGTGNSNMVATVKDAEKAYANINYYGLVDGELKKEVFTNSDVFVLQTHYTTEGVPLAILEAMSYKCAIVTTKHNGIPETVNDSAFYIQKKNTKDLIEALALLEANRELLLEFQQKAFNLSKHYSLSHFEKNIMEVFCKEIES